jgi:hypothetical protein
MEYVIPLILVLLIAGAGVVAFVMNARRKTSADGHDRVAADEGQAGGPGIGADPTPLGDTEQHAGEQRATGGTATPPDAERFGGTGRPLDHYGATVPEERERDGGRERGA